MSITITPRSESGRWSLLFAAITVVATLIAWITLGPMMEYPFFNWVWYGFGQAVIAPAAATAVLGLVSVIHHKERSVLSWTITLASLAMAVVTGAVMLSAVAQY
ncbi:hypothetical protein [Pseudarthrobacter sp. LT1]|uniref:hypothetical protein n=1 Tax=Pseudarthrobacter sp. LT1 TaxID=3111450 RepID=UPI002D78040C|nr:hypothetical protein [Pseudarthrobacter sp. LT1]WRT12055.1 hypothetical protein VIK36_11705 [Pseudarthrobacter sp. LT1]